MEVLDREILPELLKLKYEAIEDAIAILGNGDQIAKTFMDFQRHLYAVLSAGSGRVGSSIISHSCPALWLAETAVRTVKYKQRLMPLMCEWEATQFEMIAEKLSV